MDVPLNTPQQGRGLVLVRRQPPNPQSLMETLKARLQRSCRCSVPRAWALVQDLVPVTRWLRQYRPQEDLAGDIMSGLVIGIILVPQAIAYSLLAGLQPIYSLYTSFFANLIYFLLGTSHHVSVGIFSLLCLVVGQVVDRELQLAGFDPSQDGLGPRDNGSTLNSSAATLEPRLQDCGRDCYAIRVATALTLMTGIYQAPDLELMWRVALDAVSLALVGSAFSISLAEMFARSHGYSVRANQELLAVGCCNVLPAFFHCYVTGAALSKSLVKTATGCRTQVSSLVSAAVVLLVLLALAPLFRDLQRSVLACVIVASLRGALRKVRDLPQLWRLSPADALVWAVTAATCVLVNVEAGLLAGLLLSLLSLVGRTQRPQAALLARIGDSAFYEDAAEFEGLVPPAGVRVFRFAGPLCYANKAFFLQSLYSLTGLDAGCSAASRKTQGLELGAGEGDPMEGKDPVSSGARLVPMAAGFHTVVIDCAPLLFLDVAGMAMLQDLRRDYRALGVTLLLACCSPSVRDALQRGGFLGEDQGTEEEQLFPSVHSAVEAGQARHRELLATNSAL
ncbi:PREDICTED: sulfate anion transporter 1 isoform X2 [Chinchilla lanigera]|uniref:sulfate anion transporter 1 isoform X2 n=1 Tax=Chinchilla lanigera TaxID=34839 RepID=UPI000697359E|nr:PREDICTED: sulfate anion transporter 1 isoform X2 [Chinchilla lanigera]